MLVDIEDVAQLFYTISQEIPRFPDSVIALQLAENFRTLLTPE